MKIYRVVGFIRGRKDDLDSQIICDCYTEFDAEEVGAALAKAGFDAEVWDFVTKLHEFFAS